MKFDRLTILAVAIFAVLLSIYAANCYLAVVGGYLPTSSDEVDYVKSVEYFFLNGLPHAFSTFDSLYAAGGDFSFHGPVYTVLFGAPQMAAGTYSQHFILYSNIVLSALSIVLIWRYLRDDIVAAALCASLVLSAPVFLMYSTSYMMETLQILVAIGFAISFSWLLKRPFLLVVSSLVFGFSRQSNFLYSVPYLAPKWQFGTLARWGIWLGFFGLLLFEIRYFHASFPGGKFQAVADAITNRDLGAAAGIALANLFNGLRSFLFTIEDGLFYAVARYVFLAATVGCLIGGITYRNPALVAAGFVGSSYALALWILYDVGGWRDLRSLAGVTAFVVIVLAKAGFTRLLWVFLVAQLIAYPSLYAYRDTFIRERVIPFKERMASDALVDAYSSLRQLQSTSPDQRFLLVGIEPGLFTTEMSPELLSLPVRSDDGLAIRYTFQRLRPIGDDEGDYLLTKGECRFGPAVNTTSYFRACPMKRS